jgi:putative polyhydroxyalkanoate system protein
MAKIEIRRPHSLTLAQAKKQANVMAAHLKEEFDLESTWDKDKLRFTRAGVDGVMNISGEDVHVLAELGFLVSFLKPKIESRLHAHFDDIFGPPETGAKKASEPAKKAPAKKTAAKPKR